MKNLKRKINCALTLSVVSLLIVVAIVCLWMFKSQKIAVVTLDTFVGVIVALLAVIVTVAIGWQIWAAMDMKSNIAKLDARTEEFEALKPLLKKYEEDFEQLTFKNKHLIGLTWGRSAIKEEDWVGAFRFILISFLASMKLQEPMNISCLFELLDAVSYGLKRHDKCSIDYFEEIKTTDKEIRALSNYSLVEDRYEPLYNDIFSKIQPNDDQK